MDLENMWTVFLSKIEIKLKPVLFQTWFKDTKLVDLNNEYAIVLVPLDNNKKHLKENYSEIIKETFMEVTGSIFKFEYVTEEEYYSTNNKEKEIIKDNNEAIFESGLDSKCCNEFSLQLVLFNTFSSLKMFAILEYE